MTSPGAITPVLVLDPEIELGRGLTQQLARYGFRVDLALTENAARVCLWHKSYRAMIIVADLSRPEGLLQLQRMREAALQTWMIVLTTPRENEASEIVRGARLPAANLAGHSDRSLAPASQNGSDDERGSAEPLTVGESVLPPR